MAEGPLRLNLGGMGEGFMGGRIKGRDNHHGIRISLNVEAIA